MTLPRRAVLAAALLSLAAPALAQDWKSKYPELVYATIPAENASGVTERFGPWMEYLSKELGVKVTLRIAADYAAVIEGQRAGTIHIGDYGPSSYVRAHTVSNGGVEAFATMRAADGSTGYYSVAYAKKDAAGAKLEDFKGKNLCLVDPNSTSGFNVPMFAMNKASIDPAKFFGKVVNAGSHENAVMAVQQGTCDVAFNWWNSEDDSNLSRMANKSMVKKDDFKIVFRSELIPGSPYAVLTSMPADLKAAIAKAFFDAPTKAPEAFKRLSDGKSPGFAAVKHSDYKVTEDLQKFVDALRKKGS
ncbi:MAG: phosphonate ABC transporter substrate-binding protein [Methylobacterium sp.]|nr:phosphonate ABC transporter substrate-binding protein [Methylobacterium sp.]MCA3602684.1 phosphonate ABC transporter substrate-binding protein [Methylobacterium sp.]MCA3613597.1 phosphonate ABC transporter substrate-binding protein [Methylobacterium sp.]MCA3625761.1 phosphonate ABC transporter substrate-binding protein [Methylobacterium sp.]MCA4910532.1 phosphonate ABC transporter substrate-binding protein [Methylobacterium sp.]